MKEKKGQYYIISLFTFTRKNKKHAWKQILWIREKKLISIKNNMKTAKKKKTYKKYKQEKHKDISLDLSWWENSSKDINFVKWKN